MQCTERNPGRIWQRLWRIAGDAAPAHGYEYPHQSGKRPERVRQAADIIQRWLLRRHSSVEC